MRIKSIDNFLIALMALLALGAVYNLYGGKYFAANKSDAPEIASIVDQIKVVKRKKDFYQSWLDVNPGDGLSANEQIYTHGQSSAKIKFAHGPVITLFENSLLRIKGNENDRSLDLEKGNLNATLSKEAPKLNIQLNGKMYSFESQKADIQIEQGEKENKFMLLEGTAKLNINQKAQEIKANEVIVQDKKTGSVKINALPFKVLSPLNNTSLYFNTSSTLSFKWNYLTAEKKARLLVARSSTFDSPEIDQLLESDQVDLTFKEEGQYYWKLMSSDQTSGPIKSFNLIKEKPLEISLDKGIIYKGPKAPGKVVVSWSHDKSARYLLKIISPEKKESELITNKTFAEVSLPDFGAYHFSVKVHDEKRPEAIESSLALLEVLEARMIELKSNMPETLEKISYKDEPANFLISWQGPGDGVNYSLKAKNESGEILEFKSSTNSALVSLKKSGHYRWSVSGENESGVTTNTIGGEIILKASLMISQTPAEGAVIELERPDQLVTFKWNQVENAGTYEFEISEDKSFKDVLYETTAKATVVSTALAKTGRYYWRVKAKNGSETLYSTPQSVEIKPTPPLSGPSELPKIKIKLKYEGQKETTSFLNLLKNFFIAESFASDVIPTAEWDIPANARARFYIVEIYADPDLTQLITKIKSERPHIVWKNAAPGVFYWRMSYEDYWGRHTDFSRVSTLSTEDDQEFLEAVELKKMAALPLELSTPKHKEDILTSVDDTATFSWGTLPKTESYQFLVDKDLEFGHPLIDLKVKTNSLLLNCKQFKNAEGDYYWKVIGNLGNVSKRRQFHISCEKKPEIIPPPVMPEVATTPKPEVSEAKPLVEEKKEGLKHFWSLGFTPHKLSYQNKASQYTAKVDGVVLNSFEAEYQRPTTFRYIEKIRPSLNLSRGKVFNSITFTDFALNLKLQTEASLFSWGPVISYVKKTLYLEAAQAISATAKSSPLAGLFIEKKMKSLCLGAEIKALSATSMKLKADYELSEKYRAGLYLESSSLKEGSTKHSFTEAGLSFNYLVPLLESAK